MAQNDCAAMRTRMSAYLDGESDDAASQILLAHLNGCAECATFYNTLRKTLMLYKNLPPDKMDDSARTRLQRILNLDQT